MTQAIRPFFLACSIALIAWLQILTRQQNEMGECALTRIYTVYTCLLLALAACSMPNTDGTLVMRQDL